MSQKNEVVSVHGLPVAAASRASLLNPGFDLTLRPMRYPRFYEMYRAAIKNTWTVEEIDFQIDLGHLRQRMTPAERHLIERLVAFFATGDSIVSNNLVISLYRHINAPEARMYLSRQLFEEALHIQFYLTLLDNYVPDQQRRAEAFAAIENIPSIRRKAEFCQRWTDDVFALERTQTQAEKRRFLLNLTCFACCIEGLFFFGAFAYVYFLRSRGLLPGLAAGTNWVFRDESAHMAFAFAVIETVRHEEPQLFDAEWASQVREMIQDAVECETAFAEDVLSGGVVGMTRSEMRQYLEYVADQRLAMLGLPMVYGARNPFSVHAIAGRPGTHEFLRAPRFGLSGGRARGGLFRRRLLTSTARAPGAAPGVVTESLTLNNNKYNRNLLVTSTQHRDSRALRFRGGARWVCQDS